MWKPQPLCPPWSQLPEPLKQAPLWGLKTQAAQPQSPLEAETSAPPITTFTGDQGPGDPALATSFRPHTVRIQLFPQLPFSKAPRLIGPQPLVQSDNQLSDPLGFLHGVGGARPSQYLSPGPQDSPLPSHLASHFVDHTALPRPRETGMPSLCTSPGPRCCSALSSFHSLVTQGEVTAPGAPIPPNLSFPRQVQLEAVAGSLISCHSQEPERGEEEERRFPNPL